MFEGLIEFIEGIGVSLVNQIQTGKGPTAQKQINEKVVAMLLRFRTEESGHDAF